MVQSSNLLEMIVPPSAPCPTSSSLEYYTLKTPNKQLEYMFAHEHCKFGNTPQ
jgi:hypothetical protein